MTTKEAAIKTPNRNLTTATSAPIIGSLDAWNFVPSGRPNEWVAVDLTETGLTSEIIDRGKKRD